MEKAWCSVAHIDTDDVESRFLFLSAVMVQKMDRCPPNVSLFFYADTALGAAAIVVPNGFHFDKEDGSFWIPCDDIQFSVAVAVIARQKLASVAAQVSCCMELCKTAFCFVEGFSRIHSARSPKMRISEIAKSLAPLAS